MSDTHLFARHALLLNGWKENVRLNWDRLGDFTEITPNATPHPDEPVVQHIIPGMINLHSHAFQRALNGLTESATQSTHNFWTWRTQMYRLAHHVQPEHLEAIAAQIFSECLRYGYTSLCEFHYLHHAQDGSHYANPLEMAERILSAAQTTGIGITLLPVLYSFSNFGQMPLTPEQTRFKTDVTSILQFIDTLNSQRNKQIEIGVAPHSLRATSVEQINELLTGLPEQRPIHIHIAEQTQEINECLTWCARRPIQWLYDHVPVDARWCLVHATHLNADELHLITQSQAVVGLCPTTEANLGDGLFPLPDFLRHQGRWGIGSDSHVSHNPVEELRWLEYGQRLHHQKRTLATTKQEPHTGNFLWQNALTGGAQASGRPIGALAVGKRADFIVLNSDHPNLCDRPIDEILDTFIFCGNDNLVQDVMVGGHWVIKAQQHIAQEAITQRFKHTLAELRRC